MQESPADTSGQATAARQSHAGHGTSSARIAACMLLRLGDFGTYDAAAVEHLAGRRDGGIARQRSRFQAALLDVNYFLHALLPIVELLLHFILGDAIPFLDLARNVFALACNDAEPVIGELAPLLFDIAL